MGYWTKTPSQYSISSSNRRPFVDQSKASGKLLRTDTARALIKESEINMGSDEFYEMELAEVMDVILSEDRLPEREDGAGKDWSVMGAVLARTVRSERGRSVDDLVEVFSPGQWLYRRCRPVWFERGTVDYHGCAVRDDYVVQCLVHHLAGPATDYYCNSEG